MKVIHFGGNLWREHGAEKEWQLIKHTKLDQLLLWQVELHPTGELCKPMYHTLLKYSNTGVRQHHIYSSTLLRCLKADSGALTFQQAQFALCLSWECSCGQKAASQADYQGFTAICLLWVGVTAKRIWLHTNSYIRISWVHSNSRLGSGEISSAWIDENA